MQGMLHIETVFLVAGSIFGAGEAADPGHAFFESKIRPVLVEHCYECHAAGAKIVQGGLHVDSRDGLLKGGDSGPALVPGKADESLLLDSLHYETYEMPPKGKLPDAVIRDFETWIAMGAPDPRKENEAVKKRGVDIAAGRKHWAFQPIADPALPPVSNKEWPLDPVDHFLLAKLESSSLHPVVDVDRHTWLRRVSLDLAGLPPTLAEIESFVNDGSPAAHETVVDRLLNGRSFGERWARHWLDLTGYADQIGTSNNVFAEHAWRYRDYLIAAFNEDKPFDRFIREQIAGDLLPYGNPAERAENTVATGFLVLGDVEIVNPDKLKMEADLIDQQVSKVGTVFLGMTLGCVRCHDHKFDPIGLDDYYGIAGIFRSTVSTQKIPYGVWSSLNVADLPETPEQIRARASREVEHRRNIERLKVEQSSLNAEKVTLAAALGMPEADAEALKKKTDEVAKKLKTLTAAIEHAEFFTPAPAKAFAVQDATQISDMRVTIRGNPYALGTLTPRGVVRVASWESSPAIPTDQSGRRQLADWLADKRNPLTARVAVNRIWQKLFGEGIVRSVDYFGVRGELPTHPELLDHLARRFMQEGWSQKRLIRALTLSRAYRLSSDDNAAAREADPDNRLLWRMNRQRLDAESLRDAMLAASGELIASPGGPALPLEYIENTGGLRPTGVNPPNFALKKFRPTQEFERTIYLPVVRFAQSGPARLRNAFDFTQPAQIAGKRAQTVVPTQALFLLNDEMPRRRAQRIAADLLAVAVDRDARLQQLWLRALNRPITPAEQKDASAFLDTLAAMRQTPPTNEAIAWTELCHAVLSSNEFIHRL